jgi:winged helix DNA-binding protein
LTGTSTRDMAHRRMLNQRLWGTPFGTPEEVVRWFAALQAQDFLVAKWSVAQRTIGVTNTAMDQAFADGAILRTHLLRPTWHFVLPEDIRWMLDLTAPRVNALNAHPYRRLELDVPLFAKTNALIARALDDGKHLTRKELAGVLARAGIDASGQRLAYILMRAELDGVICSGARKGKQHTYAALHTRAPRAGTLDRDAGLAELTKRYFTSRGPATLKDYVRWSSLTAAEARSGLDSVKSELENEGVDGRTYWFAAPGESPNGRRSSRVIDLIQGLDEYVMSYSESRDVLLGTPATEANARVAIVFNHVVLLDGQVIGQWKPVSGKDSIVIETSMYRPFRRAEAAALETAALRYGRFLESPITLHAPPSSVRTRRGRGHGGRPG